MSVHHFTADLLNQVDQYGAHFTAQAYQHLVSRYTPLMMTLVTLYLAWTFILINRGVMSLTDLPFTLLRITCIVMLALNYHYFCLFIYDVFTNAPMDICQALLGSEGNAYSISGALDRFLDTGTITANKISMMGSWLIAV